MNEDFRDLLRAFTDLDVRFLIVGAYAVSAHSEPRATGDLDVWIDPAADNAERAFAALRAFGAPLHELDAADLSVPGTVFQIGLPPRRIDILTSITGVSFPEAWADRTAVEYGGIPCHVIGRDALVANKRLLGRAKDLADLELLERHRRRS